MFPLKNLARKELEFYVKPVCLQWVISFRANYSNQLTCIAFAVTNNALPVKGLAKDPHKQTHFSAILAHGCWFEKWHG